MNRIRERAEKATRVTMLIMALACWYLQAFSWAFTFAVLWLLLAVLPDGDLVE